MVVHNRFMTSQENVTFFLGQGKGKSGNVVSGHSGIFQIITS